METKSQILIKAKQQISLRRQKALAIAQAEKAVLYKQLPILIEYDNRIINCGISAARFAADGATENALQKKVELKQIETEREKILSDNGFSADKISPRFVCKNCKDTGRQNGKACSCVNAVAKAIRRDFINNSSPLTLSSFTHFSLEKYSSKIDTDIGVCPKDVMAEIFDYCKSYADNFTQNAKSLFLMGTAGLGKTHLALSIANYVLDKGFDVIYVSSQNAFDNIEKEHFLQNTEETTLAAMLETDLLVLDDLGTEFITPYTLSTIYSLINTRINSQKPTIYTSNILTQQLLNTRYTEKVASRLLGSCIILHFEGSDVRLLNT